MPVRLICVRPSARAEKRQKYKKDIKKRALRLFFYIGYFQYSVFCEVSVLSISRHTLSLAAHIAPTAGLCRHSCRESAERSRLFAPFPRLFRQGMEVSGRVLDLDRFDLHIHVSIHYAFEYSITPFAIKVNHFIKMKDEISPGRGGAFERLRSLAYKCGRIGAGGTDAGV